MKKAYALILGLLLISCSQKSNEAQKNDSSTPSEFMKSPYVLPLIPDSIKEDKTACTIFLTNLYEDGVSSLIASNFSVETITEKRILIISESEFTYHPLGFDVSVQGLQAVNENIFNVEKGEESYYKLSYQNSYIKTAHINFEGWECDEYVKIDEDYIVCAEIADTDIKIGLHMLHIGMTKQDLFYNKFGLQIPLSIDTLDLSCTTGDIQHQYIFKSDTLEKVRLASNSDWADFDLY